MKTAMSQMQERWGGDTVAGKAALAKNTIVRSIKLLRKMAQH